MTGHLDAPADLDARGLSFALIAARFNADVVSGLVEGARAALLEHGAAAEAIDLVYVPGAWELPLAAMQIAEEGAHDAIVALGAVIRGATPHFEFVAGECAAGLARVALDQHTPVAFGVLTCDDAEQARQRSGPGAGNKGGEAAIAAIEMALLLATLDGSR